MQEPSELEKKVDRLERGLQAAMDLNENLHQRIVQLTEALRLAKLRWWQSKEPKVEEYEEDDDGD